jgi:hypothetical protein
MAVFYKKTANEELEVVNLEHKLNNNKYSREIKIFGLTVYRYEYTLKCSIKAEPEQNKVGFTIEGK